MPRFTVAIAGAGIGGLVFALALEKYAPDVDFQIYEAVSQLSTVGAGIGIQPRSWYIMEQLGLHELLLKISGDGRKPKMPLLYRKSDQPDGFQFLQGDPVLEENMTFHRGELQEVFFEHLRSPERVHLGKRVVSYTQPSDCTSKIEIQFQDGTTATCDVLVGADGIKSNVRKALYTHLANAAEARQHTSEAEHLRSYIPVVYTGASVYRGVLKRELGHDRMTLPLNASNIIMHAIAYPIQQGRALNVGAVVWQYELENTLYDGPWVADVAEETVRKAFTGWEPEVEDIMQNISTWSKWAINVVKKLPTFVDGRVVLLGDAAHGMPPHQGAGAGQGFEDALLLAQLLGQPTVDVTAIPTALKIYDQIRRPVVQDIAACCLQSGKLHSLLVPELVGVTPEMSHSGNVITKQQMQHIAEEIERVRKWRKGPSVEEDCKKAVLRLQEELSTAAP
ncbi:FAD/NAD-P-binding domain-containing protein [Trametes elegans]|nr:FAD/NAD-P-binding domain-containing protein [Trametes elegans]